MVNEAAVEGFKSSLRGEGSDAAIALHVEHGAKMPTWMDEGEDRIRATYGKNYARLEKVEKRYDPKNLFRVNQNIKPAK